MSSSEHDKQAAGIATAAENARLAHSESGVTTRQDATDLGVPMLPGSPDEPIGPEDALGPGPKRGDYRQRIGPDNYHPTQVVPKRDAQGRPPAEGEPQVEVVAQRPLAEDIGDEVGRKGGVDTAREEARPAAAARDANRPAADERAGQQSAPTRTQKP